MTTQDNIRDHRQVTYTTNKYTGYKGGILIHYGLVLTSTHCSKLNTHYLRFFLWFNNFQLNIPLNLLVALFFSKVLIVFSSIFLSYQKKIKTNPLPEVSCSCGVAVTIVQGWLIVVFCLASVGNVRFECKYVEQVNELSNKCVLSGYL